MKRTTSTVLIELILAISSVAIIFPFFWMISTSLKTEAEILRVPVTVFPHALYVANYARLLTDPLFLRFFLNSIIVASVGTVVSTFDSLAAGFVFAKFRFPGKKMQFLLILATLMIPFQCYMIPLYAMSVRLRWIDTYAGLIFPIVISSFGIFFVRQNMQSIPDSLLEAARIDGAGIWRVFFVIVLPLSVSVTVVLAIFQFMTAWGDFIWPLVVTNSQTDVRPRARSVEVPRPVHRRLRADDDGRLPGDRARGHRVPRLPPVHHRGHDAAGDQGLGG